MPSIDSFDDVFTPVELRQAFGSFATGVTVVTTRHEDKLVGLTANSFSALSLRPPLLLWCISKTTPSFAAFRDCSHYAVNILAAGQADISDRFANSSPDKFADLDYRLSPNGNPLIAGCIASFECRNEARHPGGDHLILVGRIEHYHVATGAPLLFHGSRYAALQP